MAEITLRIDGMHCASCVRRVGQALASQPGLAVREVRIGAARFQSPENLSAESAAARAVEALAKAGYKAHPELNLEEAQAGN